MSIRIVGSPRNSAILDSAKYTSRPRTLVRGPALSEEMGARATVCLRFKFLNRGGLSPYWLGVCDAVLPEIGAPDPAEVAWHGWLTEPELRRILQQWTFTPDSEEIFSRYVGG